MLDFIDLIDETIQEVRYAFSKEGRREVLSCFVVLAITLGLLGGIGYWVYQYQVPPLVQQQADPSAVQ